jgi:PAS domain S-box-containing protein
MAPRLSQRSRVALEREAARAGGRPPARRRRPPSSIERAVELAHALESASDAVVGVTREGVITSWGDGAERLFGYTSEQACGRHISMLAPPDRVDEPDDLIRRALEGGRLERLETERVSRDGCLRRVLISLTAIHDDDGRHAGVLGIFRDVSEQRSAEDALRESERRYHSLVEALGEGVVMHEAGRGIVAFNSSAQRILGLSPQELANGFPGDRGDWSLIDEAGAPVTAERYPTTVTLRTGQPQSGVVLGVERADAPTQWISVNSSPLRDADSGSPYAAVASFTDITELRATWQELQQARTEDLSRLALISEYRDDDTNRHTERVGHSSELMARSLGLDEELVWTVRRAAPLHDVGKIGIPDDVLLKPTRLTPTEFEVMKTHTTIGNRILARSHAPVLRMAASIALTHHERWDGRGYPTGLKGEKIPLVSRIVSVADAFDAMTHARPYKQAVSIEQALEELERCSGKQFDARVVAAFRTLDHALLVEN